MILFKFLIIVGETIKHSSPYCLKTHTDKVEINVTVTFIGMLAQIRKMGRLLIILALAFPSLVFGQEKLVIGNSSKVSYGPTYMFKELDSLVSVSDSGRITFCENVQVFFDSNFAMLAYKSYQSNDTCYTEDYYRNGSLKQRIKYFDFDGGWPYSHYSEFYCK